MSALNANSQAFRFRLDERSGVPIYRQVIDQVTGGIASGVLAGGHQLPTVRQVAVDLSINPNTVIRAYRELEIRGLIETQQGSGTYIAHQTVARDEAEHDRQLNQIVEEFVARAGAAGLSLEELIERLQDMRGEARRKRR